MNILLKPPFEFLMEPFKILKDCKSNFLSFSNYCGNYWKFS